MEVPAGQDGIQRLLAAEQEAQAIVAKARKGASKGVSVRREGSAVFAAIVELSSMGRQQGSTATWCCCCGCVGRQQHWPTTALLASAGSCAGIPGLAFSLPPGPCTHSSCSLCSSFHGQAGGSMQLLPTQQGPPVPTCTNPHCTASALPCAPPQGLLPSWLISAVWAPFCCCRSCSQV